MIGLNKFYNKTERGSISLETFGISEVGHKKTTNEDSFLIADINTSGKLMAVADGFSRSFGDQASRLAVGAMRDALQFTSNWSVSERLQKGVEIANWKIEKHFQKIHHSRGTGTTLSAVYVVGDTAWIAHVGNSRVYLIRDRKVKQLTTDHTMAEVLAGVGVEASRTTRKMLIQAIGVDCELAPLVIQTELLPNDFLLICSDGFSDNMDAPEIIRMLEENPDISVAAERLVEMADDRDGTDNITLILARANRAAGARESLPVWLSRSHQKVAA